MTSKQNHNLIVDIDDTLFDTVPRKIAILKDCFGIITTYSSLIKDYHLKEYLHSSQDQVKFFSQFHSGKYIHFDEPLENAPQILTRLSSKCNIIYLTGRHADAVEPWMAQKNSTLESLQRFGFPFPDGTQTLLIMKSNYEGFKSIEIQSTDDAKFKTEILHKLVLDRKMIAGIGDSFIDLLVYSENNIFPICLKRPHFSAFKKKLGEISIQPFIADNWLSIEKRVLEFL